MFKILKHASGVAIVILTAWGIGAIYEWATKDYMHWLNAAIEHIEHFGKNHFAGNNG